MYLNDTLWPDLYPPLCWLYCCTRPCVQFTFFWLNLNEFFPIFIFRSVCFVFALFVNADRMKVQRSRIISSHSNSSYLMFLSMSVCDEAGCCLCWFRLPFRWCLCGWWRNTKPLDWFQTDSPSPLTPARRWRTQTHDEHFTHSIRGFTQHLVQRQSKHWWCKTQFRKIAGYEVHRDGRFYTVFAKKKQKQIIKQTI